MPRVPTYDNFQAAQTGSPDTMLTSSSGPNASQIQGDQLQQFGAGAQRAGDSVARIAVAMQDTANQVRVNDAVNKARQAAQDLAYNPETGYLNLRGDAALTRPNGQSLPEEFNGKLGQSLSDISDTLGNDVQRRQFAMNAADLRTQFNGQVEQHMLGEFRSHALSVQDGTINLASDDAKRNWSQPDIIGKSLGAAKAAVVQKGTISGWSASQTDAALLETTSKVHTDVIRAALENNNPDYAVGYLNARKGEMTADDILRVQGAVTHQVNAGIALSAVQGATGAAVKAIAPTSFDRMTQITAMSESGNRETNADGSTVTSPKGAKGSMQVMDDTLRNPGFGLQGLDPATATPAQRAQFGKDYLQALMQHYGDPAKAWAAYNAGPGALDKALAEAQRDAGAYRGGAPADAWVSKLPKETQAYVAKNMIALGSNTVAPRPTELEFVNDAVARLPAGATPSLIGVTRQNAQQQFGVLQKSLNEQGDNALAAAQRFLASNPGTTVDQMPAPLLESLKQYAPGKIDDLFRYSKAIAKGDATTDLTLYNRLAAHPEEAAAMPDATFESLRAHLSPSDFKHFANERANALNGRTDETAGGINSKALNQSLNSRLESLQINTNPGPKDLDGRERIGGIQRFVRNSVFAAQAQTGKKFTPAELDAHIDGLFAKNVEFRTSFMGISTGSTTAQPLMSLQIGDLPADTVQQLRESFAKRGKTNPTNTDLLNAYRTYKLGQR